MNTTAATRAMCVHAVTMPLLAARDEISGETFEAARCSSCGSVITRPLPGDLGPYYPAEYHAYTASRDGPAERLRQWAAVHVVCRPISRRGPGVLLDVGCGSGRLGAAFMRLGWEVHGVEPSERAAALASQRGVTIEGRFIEDACGPFDAIVFNHSLEHIPAPDEALRTARALLKPDGLVGVSVPDFGSWQRRVFGSSWAQLDMPRHVNHFERRTLTGLFRDAGLEPIRVLRTPFLPTLLRSLGVRLPPWLGRLSCYALLPPQLLVPGDCLNMIGRPV